MDAVSVKRSPASRTARVPHHPVLKFSERQCIEVKAIPSGDLQDRQDLLRRAFSRSAGNLYKRRNFFQDYVTHDPCFKRACILGLYRNGRLISTCQVFKRTMVIGARKFSLHGLGNIATDPAFQGQGFGTGLLRWFIEYPAGQRDLSILYTGLPGFYTRLGWQQKTCRSLRVVRTASWQSPGIPTRTRRMQARDRQAVAKIYSCFNTTYDIPHLLRSQRYWSNWVLAWKLKVYGLTSEVIVDQDDNVLGYVFVSITGKQMTIEEYGAMPGKMEQVIATVIARFHRATRLSKLLFLCATVPLDEAMNRLKVPCEALRMSHGPGHAYLFNQVLEPWRGKICLWHVDHF